MIKPILEFYNNLKIPTKITIGVLLIVTGICLFAPIKILQTLGISEFVIKWKSLFGLLFLIGLGLVLMYFFVHAIYIFVYLIKKIIQFFRIKNYINELSVEDLKYVVECYYGDKYFEMNSVSNYYAFNITWRGVLTIPLGETIQLYEDYKITTKKWIVKLSEKKIEELATQKDSEKSNELKR